MPAFSICESTISTPQIFSTPKRGFSALPSINKHRSVSRTAHITRFVKRGISLFGRRPITFAIALNGSWPAKKHHLLYTTFVIHEGMKVDSVNQMGGMK
jgi:hypothetical protein